MDVGRIEVDLDAVHAGALLFAPSVSVRARRLAIEFVKRSEAARSLGRKAFLVNPDGGKPERAD